MVTGTPTTLSRARTPTRATWANDGNIYLIEGQGATLSRVPAVGGTPTRIYSFGIPSTTFDNVLRDGRAAFVTVRSTSISGDYAGIHLFTVEDQSLRPLIASAYDPRYLASGHQVFARGGSLNAVPFDIRRPAITGPEVAVVRELGMESIFGNVHAAVSDTGTLVYVAGGDFARGKIAWQDRGGGHGVLPIPERVYGSMSIRTAADSRCKLPTSTTTSGFGTNAPNWATPLLQAPCLVTLCTTGWRS